MVCVVLVTRQPAWLFERADVQDEAPNVLDEQELPPDRALLTVERLSLKPALMTACGVSIAAAAAVACVLALWRSARFDPFGVVFCLILYAIGAGWVALAGRAADYR